MINRMCEMFGIDAPIFAFSHCRDVVVEVSKAGGFGVLGMARVSPARLEEELRWIDDHIGGKPYGVDVLMPVSYEDTGGDKFDLERLLPRGHVEFVRDLLDRGGVPRLPESEEQRLMHDIVEAHNFTPAESLEMIEIAMKHPIKLIVNALGVPPPGLVERAHARGIKVAALAGKPKHALRHQAAGVDFVVAVGTEAAGHTGDITSMVLWPEIVDAVAPLPVLGAGGVGRGRQMAAAFALGCEGVWCGSIWLATVQSEILPELREMLFAAEAQDAVLSTSFTGKQCRVLRSRFTEAWEQPGAPKTLPAPLQVFLCWAHGRTRMERARAKDFLTYPVGQIVGSMRAETSVRQVVHDMLNELAETKERLDRVLG
jgi:NAD(P)H-dependent flavin oxidoreductase YrpB (nitropropane dioxygenase family)